MEDEKLKKALDFFNGDNLAATVWLKKYQYKDEETPKDSQKRYVKELAETEFERLNRESFDETKIELLSDYGQTRYGWMNRRKDNTLAFKQYIDNYLGFDKIILGGSLLQGIGRHEFFSSLSNCLVLGQPFDSYSGISQKSDEMVQACKRRMGAGIDLSTIRPNSSVVHNQSGFSSGPVLFAERYSYNTLEVGQYGRRGALMLSISINHPDSLEFAVQKQDETKLTGANTSIIVTDEFMQAVCDKKPFIQRFPCTASLETFKVDFEDLSIDKLVTCQYFDTEKGVMQTGYVKKINAKEAWKKIIKYAHHRAEPGLMFQDNWYKFGTDGVYQQYKAVTSNPCFAGDTPLLTDTGYHEIQSLVGKQVNVWNGKRWSNVIPEITNHNQEMLKITLSDGSTFRCTKYHNWPVWKGIKSRDGHEEMTQAQNLSVGDKLSKFNLPVINGIEELSNKTMYTRGFYSGDGTTGRSNIRLYGEKIQLSEFMDGYLSPDSEGIQNQTKYIDFKTTEKDLSKTFIPGCNYTIKSRLDWLAGLIDSDGCVEKQKNNIGGSAQIGSTNKEFLLNVKLMLTTLGVSSRLNNLRAEGYRDMPDQKGGLTNVFCKAGYRLLISTTGIQKLISLGLVTHRVDFTCFNPLTRDSSRFITVIKIEQSGVDADVYCFTEQYEHKAIFNGFLIGQCSEIPMQPYDSCRLIALNLASFVVNPFYENAIINKERLYEYFYEQISLCDIIVDLDAKYIDRIISKISLSKDPQELKDSEIALWNKIKNEGQKGRRCGCGFTGLGDMLASLGLSYKATDETQEVLNEVFSIKLKAELDAGIDMSILYGSFDGFDFSKEYDFYHDDTMNDDDFTLTGKNSFFQRLLDICPELIEKMMKYGRRNVSWSTAAPTGSLSILAQTTSGIEPLFLPWYMRRKKCIDASERVDYIDPADGQKFTMFPVLHYPFKQWIEQFSSLKGCDATTLSDNILKELFEQSPWFGNCANDINWQDRVKIQSIVQKYTTHSISSTINLPSDVSPDVVDSIYMESWKAGLKGNTVYRDGCRGGVLISSDTTSKNDDEDFSETRAPKRPLAIPAVYHTIRANKKVYSVIIGLLHNKPYEVFVVSGIDDLPENLDDINDSINGFLVKEGKDWYNFESETFFLRDIPDVESNEKMVSLMISMALRHRTPLKFIIKTLDKTKPFAGSFTHKLIKILSKYVPNGEVSGTKCPECGAELVYENGCVICKYGCGWSKC